MKGFVDRLDVGLGQCKGKKVRVETKDGSFLIGVLSGSSVEQVKFGVENFWYVTSITLDNDPEKNISVDRVLAISVIE